MKSRRRAFTLPELLVTLVIMGVLAELLLSGVQAARRAAAAAACTANLRQLGTAGRLYVSDNNNLLPYREGSDPSTYSFDWMQNLAPYLGLSGTESFVKIFKCPSDPSTSPKQPRTYLYNESFPSSTDKAYSRGNYIPYSFLQITKPSLLPMFFCIANTQTRLINLWEFDSAVWSSVDDQKYPANATNSFPRPHFEGKAVNAVFYDGHVEALPCPVAPVYFHFDGQP